MAAQPVPACAFDWQHASYALMTVDMVWFSNRASVRCALPIQETASYYRERLEHYLGFTFDSAQWQAMLELGYLTDTLRMGCIEAFFIVRDTTEEFREYRHHIFSEYSSLIRVGARRL